MNNKPTIPQISIDAQTLFDRLIECQVGATLSYADMNRLIGRDVQHDGHGVLQTARRKALRERRYVFGTISKVGIKRMNDIEIVDGGQYDLDHIRRQSKRAARKLASVDFNTLPNDKKIRHNAFMSVLGVLTQMTGASSVKQIEQKVGSAQLRLSVDETLAAFQSK